MRSHDRDVDRRGLLPAFVAFDSHGHGAAYRTVCMRQPNHSGGGLFGRRCIGSRHDGPLSTRCAQLCVVGVVEQRPRWPRRRRGFGAELRVAVKGRPRGWSRWGRYPRLDFFASPECRVVHGSAACDSADKECGDQCPTETNTFEHFRSPFEQLTGARGAAPVTQLLPQMNSCCRRVNSCEHQA